MFKNKNWVTERDGSSLEAHRAFPNRPHFATFVQGRWESVGLGCVVVVIALAGPDFPEHFLPMPPG